MDGAFAQRLVERGGDRDARVRLRRYHPGRLMVVPAALDLYPPGVRLIGGRRRAPIRGFLHDVAAFSRLAQRWPSASPVPVARVATCSQGLVGSRSVMFFAASLH